MPEHQDRFKTPLSSADGCPPWRNIFTAQYTLPCGVNAHVQSPFWLAQGGGTGLNIPCYRLHLSAQCCLPVLGLCQVQGEGKTIMHCLPPTFSSLPCSDTGEVCLAASKTALSSNQPATTMATIISSSVIFFFSPFFDVSSWPHLFIMAKLKTLKFKWYSIYSYTLWLGLKLWHYCWSRSNPRKEKKTSNGKLMDICWLILFIYFCGGRGQPDGADNKQMR